MSGQDRGDEWEAQEERKNPTIHGVYQTAAIGTKFLGTIFSDQSRYEPLLNGTESAGRTCGESAGFGVTRWCTMLENPANSRSRPEPEVYEAFLAVYSVEYSRIQSYIRALVPDPVDADDLFQKASLVLWRSFTTFDREKPFLPWALGVARHQVLMHWRARRRDRHVFSESFLASLADEASQRLVDDGPLLARRQQALDACVEQLPPRQRELIRRFYGNNEQAGAIAASWNRSVHAVYKALKVMRKALEECVQQRLAILGEELPPWTDGLASD